MQIIKKKFFFIIVSFFGIIDFIMINNLIDNHINNINGKIPKMIIFLINIS